MLPRFQGSILGYVKVPGIEEAFDSRNLSPSTAHDPKNMLKMQCNILMFKQITKESLGPFDRWPFVRLHFLYLSIILYIHLYFFLSIYLSIQFSFSIYIDLFFFLSIYLSRILYIYLSRLLLCLSFYIYLSIFLYLLSIYLHLSIQIIYIYLSICIYLYLSIQISLCLSIYIYLSRIIFIYLSMQITLYLSTSISVYLSICLSRFLYTHLSTCIYLLSALCQVAFFSAKLNCFSSYHDYCNDIFKQIYSNIFFCILTYRKCRIIILFKTIIYKGGGLLGTLEGQSFYEDQLLVQRP